MIAQYHLLPHACDFSILRKRTSKHNAGFLPYSRKRIE